MIAQATLGGPAGQAVLDAEADETFGAAVIHADRDGDDNGPLGLAEPLQHAGVKVHVLGDHFQLPPGHLKGRRVFKDGDRFVGLAVGSVDDRCACGHRHLLHNGREHEFQIEDCGF